MQISVALLPGKISPAKNNNTDVLLTLYHWQFEIDFGAYDEDQMASTMREEARDFYKYVSRESLTDSARGLRLSTPIRAADSMHIEREFHALQTTS